MKRIERSAIVEHSCTEMFRLVDDIESYPRFLPWCAEARVQPMGNEKRATLTASVGALRQSFTTRNRNHPPGSIDMALLEGPFRQFAAAWRFQPLSTTACEIRFSLEYEFSSKALGKLLEPLFEHIADTMVDAFTRRADEVHGRDPR
jgi:ribosome-associated toxin RatA of RatAB toxin-antitoxin module